MTPIGWIIQSPVSSPILTLHLKLMKKIDNINNLADIPDPPKKRRRVDEFSRPHSSGSARTEGYYKMDPRYNLIVTVGFGTNLSSFREKMRTKYHFHRPGVDAFNMAKLGSKDKVGRRILFAIQFTFIMI